VFLVPYDGGLEHSPYPDADCASGHTAADFHADTNGTSADRTSTDVNQYAGAATDRHANGNARTDADHYPDP
jgi:hypothetical protein